MLTVVIPFFNGHQHIRRLLRSIPQDLPVVIVDDVSDEPLQVKRSKTLVIRLERKGYFTGACNAGIKKASGDVLILNQDSYLQGTAWRTLIAEKSKHYALIGERAGENPAWPHRYVHGTFMYMRADAIKKVGLMDADEYPLWGSTCEWQLRAARNGFKTLALETVPGFVHTRGKKRFGSSIQELLRREPEQRQRMIRTPPEISVVVNAYNHGRFLQDLVNSLMGGETSLGRVPPQTYQSFELIIVDDGSKDNTQEIGRALADPTKGIRYIRRTNGGSAAAMNTGISAAHGRYIAPLDSDDMMRPNRLKLLLDACRKNPHAVAYDHVLVFTDGKLGKAWRMPEYDFYRLRYKNGMHKGIMFPKRAWIEVGGYPESMNRGREDWAFNVALGLAGWCGALVDHPGYLYRRGAHNRTLHNTNQFWRNKFLSRIMQLYPDAYRETLPMGCCGGNKSNGQKMAGKRQQTLVTPGQDGMTLIEYTGLNAGDSTWWGPVTQTAYVFGGSRRRGYVDSRDANGMINGFYDGAQPAFREVVQKEKLQEVEVTEFVPAAPVVMEVAKQEEVRLTSIPDPNDMTVSELIAYLETVVTVQEAEELLEMEQHGKNRKTAVKAIKDLLNA